MNCISNELKYDRIAFIAGGMHDSIKIMKNSMEDKNMPPQYMTVEQIIPPQNMPPGYKNRFEPIIFRKCRHKGTENRAEITNF